ncbi:MAG: hypothetical protein QGG53_18020, partial [Planctomycetota bacterium]|nr:hypothetical protein [Planctomycetota bacterium]
MPIAPLALLLFTLAATAFANPIIINEFNSSDGLSGFSGATLNVNPDSARFGRSGLAVEYKMQMDARGRVRVPPGVNFGAFSGSGTASVWVRGDGSRNSVRIELARVFRNERGQELYLAGNNKQSGRWVTWLSGDISLGQKIWRELSLRIPPLSTADRKRKVKLRGRLVIVPFLEKGKLVTPSGSAEFDSLRLFDPTDSGEKGFVAAGLVRQVPFLVDQPIELFANVINYTKEKAAVKLRTLIIDRNDIQVGGNEISVEVLGRAEIEKFIPLQFEVSATTPPLTVELEVRSRELQIQTSREFELAVINTRSVIDSFEQTHTRWWTKAGYAPKGFGQNHFGASHPSKQVKIDALSTGARSAPSCLRVQYDVSAKGSYAILTDQFLPGGPATLGVWVKGDGSPHQLQALLEERHPITGFRWRWKWGTPPWDKTNRNYGGPNEYMHTLSLGDLSSKDWKFLQVKLPGGGIGNYNQKLRGPLMDFPFEFKGFLIKPAKGGAPSGEILVDDLSVDTQVSPSETLLAFVFASDQAQNFAKAEKLHARFENSALFGDAAFNCTWTINDANGETFHSERRKFDIPRGKGLIDSLDMAPLRLRQILSTARGPLAVNVTLVDAADPARRASHTIWLKKPDSSVLCFDFENERTYYPQGKFGPSNTRSPANAHDGKFALHLKAEPAGKDGKGGRSEGVRLSPALPGITTGISLWAYGDGSGAILYPFVTDSAANGRHSKWANEKFSLGPVLLNWKGWRQITLDLPNLGEHSTDGGNEVAEITYPVDLSFVLEGSGQVWIDEIRAHTHLAP